MRTLEQHGLSKTSTYRAWQDMRQRCYNQRNKFFGDYGGRGVSVCDEWNTSFECFISDMGMAPPGRQLDRIDNDAGYCKSNCRWSLPIENSNNQRRTKLVTYNGQTKALAVWARELNLPYARLRDRFNKRYPPEVILAEGKFNRHNIGMPQ